MADEQIKTGDGSGLGSIPLCITDRIREVRLTDGSLLTVRKLPAVKFLKAVKIIAANGEEMADSLKAAGGDKTKQLFTVIKHVDPDQLLSVVRMSLRGEDQKRADDLFAEELFDVGRAIFDLNFTDLLKKKLTEVTPGKNGQSNQPSDSSALSV